MKFVILIMAIIVMCGCMLYAPSYYDYARIMDWVHANVKYGVRDDDAWQMPDETLESGVGDCKAQVLLLLESVKVAYGVRGQFVIISHGDTKHALAQFDMYYDPTHNTMSDTIPEGCELLRVMSYEEAMWYGFWL